MFFEPLPEPTPLPPLPEVPDWMMPPWDEMGAGVATDLVLARTPNVAITLPSIRAFRAGCRMNVEIVLRHGDLSPDDFLLLQTCAYPVFRGTGFRWDKMLRFGVRYADGSKASTFGELQDTPLEQGQPTGPLLTWIPRGPLDGGGALDLGVNTTDLWLWPLPPAETFEIGVEWPVGGIDLIITELDGAAITSAAPRSLPYWPGSPASRQPPPRSHSTNP